MTHRGVALWQPQLKALNYQKPYGATWEVQQWQILLEAIHFFHLLFEELP